MTNTEFIFFCLGALSLFIGLLAHNPMKQLWHAVKSWISHKLTPKPQPRVYCDDLQSQINELKEQLAARDTNRKNNVRREVRDYLQELRDNK